jgi:hypothetical protein
VSDRLPVEVRVDPAAPKGDLAAALAALLLRRARAALGKRARAAGEDRRVEKPDRGVVTR